MVNSVSHFLGKTVFVQCTEMRSPHVHNKGPPKKTVITGIVLVTKCPCLHPGDRRKFTAVDVPEIHHVIDCIVFPAQGPRPHPDEMARPDLDGDEYVGIREKCLFFSGPNRKPMNFSDRNAESHGKQITVHFENRILREFTAEFAIRRSFRDDNLDKLYFPLNLHSSLDAILNAAVARFLHDGLQVYKVLKFTERPSPIKDRYAGDKGMFCVNPALPQKQLPCLRPNMQKFPCYSSEYLEVVKLSTPRSMTLNRPLITILEQLLVPTDAFVYLQESMILDFADALVNEARAVAVLSAWSKLQLPYEDLSKAGFQVTLDPFFRSLLLAVYRNAVAGLRYKTRIALPVDRARNMLGVVDTTNKLRYGEVFVQCTKMRSPHVQHKGPPKRTVITGTVLVTKCPCVHPGDVRKFTAVDVPELHHVIDCIVFPAHGPIGRTPMKWLARTWTGTSTLSFGRSASSSQDRTECL
ncbi:uncharacterized protein LOC142775166 [Rhipicephalus microplus]|uniref:uncharacterized protein LOC142775166 n=1 Tax=Rhipicephalus microplus TaxID=6941 RepID=UPI003F6B02FE